MARTNVLVVGTVGVKTSLFCELFQKYLTCDSYKPATNWTRVSAINLRLICASEDSYISQQIVSLLSDFQEERSLSTIIILKSSEKDDISKLKRFIFHNFKPNNILYIYAHDNGFNFNEDTLYDASKPNCHDAASFFKNIGKCIAANENKIIRIRTEISNELLINLIDNLFELLIPICIYIMADFKKIEIIKFRRNVTHSYTNQRTKRIKAEVSDAALYVKINTPRLKSHDYFQFGPTKSVVIKNQNEFDAEIAIDIVATFYLFKKQNQKVANTNEDIFSKFLDIKNTGIFSDNFQKELIKKVKELEDKSEAITKRDIVTCLKNLYQIEAKIIPKFIEEIFPDNICYLYLLDDKSVQDNVFEFCLQEEPAKNHDNKFKIRTKKSVPKFKSIIQRIKNYF